MLSNKPYLLRAFFQWIVDSGCTPIMVLDVTFPGCKVPKQYADGGEIVFNVAASAVRDFHIANDHVEFKASFSGVIHIISAPIAAVLAIYAEENNEGLFLDADEVEGAMEEDAAFEKNEARLLADTAKKEKNVTPAQGEVTAGKNKPFLTLVE